MKTSHIDPEALKKLESLPRFQPLSASYDAPKPVPKITPEKMEKITEDIVFTKISQYGISVTLNGKYDMKKLVDGAEENLAVDTKTLDSSVVPQLGDVKLFCAIFATEECARSYAFGLTSE